MIKAAGLFVVCISLALAAVWQQVQAAEVAEVCDLSFSGGAKLSGVPIARTRAQYAKGLSNRTEPGAGMLFVFEQPAKLAFWMRDTFFPLSIAFMSEDGTVFLIENMQPESDEYHLSMRPAKYALEVEQGKFQREGILAGEKMLKIECRSTE